MSSGVCIFFYYDHYLGIGWGNEVQVGLLFVMMSENKLEKEGNFGKEGKVRKLKERYEKYLKKK